MFRNGRLDNHVLDDFTLYNDIIWSFKKSLISNLIQPFFVTKMIPLTQSSVWFFGVLLYFQCKFFNISIRWEFSMSSDHANK